ncbi:MAG TPA: HEAT repeat domain-containing protein [Ignavibacteriales bacterium]|nr:HEAT repeat domain-containing protein [Ignavibacteriales bacterium]
MKLRFIVLTLILSAFCTRAEVIIKKPIKKNPTSFAIIVDKATYEKTAGAVDTYRDAVENDGLSAYILISNWKSPDEIRSEILKLYHGKSPLEGIVLVGDVPIPMVRNAQHMTSAFKLDENAAMFKSSVPTDRFYDDFDLKFNYISHDTVHKLCYYYSLAPDSPQRVDKDIYSGRIKAPVEDDSKYEIIKNYLLRVSEEKKKQNKLDNMLVFTGHGYNSQAQTAWSDENLALREQLPSLYNNTGGRLKKLNFSMSTQMKEIILSELQKPELDMAVFHAHGEIDRQYLIDYPNPENPAGQIESVKLYLRSKLRSAKRRKMSLDEAKKYFVKQYNVPVEWMEDAFADSVLKADSLLDYSLDIHAEDARQIAPGAELVIFDECFNGSFHHSPYIAGEYVFGKGQTVAGIANTTNALQDQWIDSFMGLLGYGLRFGQWHRMDNLLESHLIGDPTFHYTPAYEGDLNRLIVLNSKDVRFWQKMAKSEDINLRSLGIYMTFKCLGAKFEKELVSIYKTDPSFNVRMHALEYLSILNTKAFEDVVKISINDPYELIRRITAEWMGKIGKEEYIPLMVRQMFDDESERVSYNVKSTVVYIDPLLAYNECIKYIDSLPATVDKEKMKNGIKISILNSEKWLNEELIPNVKSDTLAAKQKLKEIRTFRNYNFIQALPVLIEIAKDGKEPKEIRKAILEALGWYAMAYNRDIIIKACDELIKREDSPIEVKEEALRTKNRLLEGYSNTITS